jgi:hypothetical protein
MNLFNKITQAVQGKHTAFILANMTIGVVLAWFHRLDTNLVTLLLGLQGLVLAHSTKESYFENKGQQ